MTENIKPILCLDFDGVIHSYTSGWKGADVIPDPPVPGAKEFLTEAVKHFEVHIYSSRSGQPGGINAMMKYVWMQVLQLGPYRDFHEVADAIKWPTEKPPAMVTIDDRALTFTGVFPSIENLKKFQPWYKLPKPDPHQCFAEPEGNEMVCRVCEQCWNVDAPKPKCRVGQGGVG